MGLSKPKIIQVLPRTGTVSQTIQGLLFFLSLSTRNGSSNFTCLLTGLFFFTSLAILDRFTIVTYFGQLQNYLNCFVFYSFWLVGLLFFGVGQSGKDGVPCDKIAHFTFLVLLTKIATLVLIKVSFGVVMASAAMDVLMTWSGDKFSFRLLFILLHNIWFCFRSLSLLLQLLKLVGSVEPKVFVRYSPVVSTLIVRQGVIVAESLLLIARSSQLSAMLHEQIILPGLITDDLYNNFIMAELTEEEKQQLLKATERKISKMHEDKKEAPSLIIPKSLLAFARTDPYQRFLFGIFQYCKAFSQSLKKYQTLREQLQGRMSEEIMLLQKEKDALLGLQKQLSYLYAQILLTHASKSVYKDQFFFQTLIYLISRVLKDFFPRQEFLAIEEEINRLFRTNRYNLIKKRHQNDQLMREFPALKEQTKRKKVNLTTIIAKAPEKMQAFRQLQKKKREQSVQDYSTLLGQNQIKDELQRSPLLCTWLPSKKSMLNEFTRPRFHSLFREQTTSEKE